MLTHHALSSQEIRDDLLVYIVHQSPRTLVVVACIDEELLAGVFVDKWTHLCGCDENTSECMHTAAKLSSYSK